MDILGTLVGGQACAADGTVAARNPISRLVDSLMEGSAGGQQQKGRTRRSFNPQQGGAQGAMAMHHPSSAAAAGAAAAAAHAHAQGLSRGMQGGMARPAMEAGMGPAAGQWMGPHGNASQHHPQVQVLLRRPGVEYKPSCLGMV